MMFELFVAIRPENLVRAKIKEQVAEWGGETLSYDPPRYDYCRTLVFDEFQDTDYFKRYYGSMLCDNFEIDNYRTFYLLGDHLRKMERTVNHHGSNLERQELYQFLVHLGRLDDFALFLVREEEEIDKRYRITAQDELPGLFCRCLNWDSPEGAFMIKGERQDGK